MMHTEPNPIYDLVGALDGFGFTLPAALQLGASKDRHAHDALPRLPTRPKAQGQEAPSAGSPGIVGNVVT